MSDLEAIALVQRMRENLSGSGNAQIRRTRNALDRVLALAVKAMERADG